MTPQTAPLNIDTVRTQARQHMESGAVTVGYQANRTQVLDMLNDALATELVCALRYRRHHFMVRGLESPTLATEFLEHANEELAHADLLAARIVQLGDEPDFSPDTLSRRSHAQYVTAPNLPAMVRENLVAERIAIDCYRHFITLLRDDDPTTRRMLESILAVEEQHADELAGLLKGLPLQLMTSEPGARATDQ